MSARNFKPRTCERCGREYVPTASTQRYCSQTCRFGTCAERPKEPFVTRELLMTARVAVAALDEVQRLRLKALLATGRAWREMDEEVLV